MSDKTDTSGTDSGHVREMSATERLRALLDERGVEWRDSSDENVLHTTWNYMECWFNEFPDGWTAWGMAKRGTPEQAIAATLGRGTCHAIEVPMGMHDDTTATVCSACRVAIDELSEMNYCPNCGRAVVE